MSESNMQNLHSPYTPTTEEESPEQLAARFKNDVWPKVAAWLDEHESEGEEQ